MLQLFILLFIFAVTDLGSIPTRLLEAIYFLAICHTCTVFCNFHVISLSTHFIECLVEAFTNYYFLIVLEACTFTKEHCITQIE